MTVRRRAGLMLVVLLVATPVWAWNAAGHRLVANIAWLHLEPEVREQASLLLHAHPDHERWRGDGSNRQMFVAASTWADEIRKDTRFYDAGSQEATPVLPGFPDMERHRDWHFVNRPLSALPAPAAVSGNLDRELAALAHTLDLRAPTPASTMERSYALPWLIHLVGDAHQPLHASLRVQTHARDEQQIVINPYNPRKRRSTFHAFWDDLPGPASLRGEQMESATRRLIATYSPPPPGASSGDWLAESWLIARESAYPASDENPLAISAAFYSASQATADRRVTEAGYRLADLLNRLLKAP